MLTASPGCYLAEDPSLMHELPEDVAVHRTGSWELKCSARLQRERRRNSRADAGLGTRPLGTL